MADVTVNVYTGDSQGQDKQPTQIGKMPAVGKPYVRSAEFMVKNNFYRRLFVGSLVSTFRSDPVTVKGIVANFDWSESQRVNIILRQSDLTQLNLGQTASDEWTFLNQDGTPSDVRVIQFSISDALGGINQLYSGIFIDEAGDETEFVINADPAPAAAAAAVVVPLAIVGAVVCVIKFAIEALTADCKAAIAACTEAGGIPTTVVDSIFGFNLNPKFRIGCQYTCTVTCTPASPAAPTAPVTPVTPVTPGG